MASKASCQCARQHQCSKCALGTGVLGKEGGLPRPGQTELKARNTRPSIRSFQPSTVCSVGQGRRKSFSQVGEDLAGAQSTRQADLGSAGAGREGETHRSVQPRSPPLSQLGVS